MPDEKNRGANEPQGGERQVLGVADHGAAFGAKRTANLAGLGGRKAPGVPPGPPPSFPQPPVAPVVTQQPDDSEAKAAPSETRKPRAPRKAPAKSSATAATTPPGTTTTRLPDALRNRLKNYADKRRIDYARVLLEAFEMWHERIPELFTDDAKIREELGLPTGGGLFAPRPVRVLDTRGVGTAQVNFSTTVAEREVIEGLVDLHDFVPDRNALIVRVLRAHLDAVAPEDESGSE